MSPQGFPIDITCIYYVYLNGIAQDDDSVGHQLDRRVTCITQRYRRSRDHLDAAGFQGRRNGAEAIAAYGNDPANPASRSGDNRRKLKTKRSEVIEVLKASIEGLEYTLNEREDNSGIISK